MERFLLRHANAVAGSSVHGLGVTAMNGKRIGKVKVKVGCDDKRLDDPILLCLQNE